MEKVLCIVIGYVFGLIETGYIYGKCKSVDIRKRGSGNAGTTNALRVFGAKAGIITFLGDFLKAVVALLVVGFMFKDQGYETVSILQMYTGFGVVLGHDFPAYLKFKGGKGIASTAGVMIMINPIGAIIALVSFLMIALISRYVSIASITAIILMTAMEFIFGKFGMLGLTGTNLVENYIIMVALAVLAIAKHRGNIKRLIQGKENQLNLHGKSEIS